MRQEGQRVAEGQSQLAETDRRAARRRAGPAKRGDAHILLVFDLSGRVYEHIGLQAPI